MMFFTKIFKSKISLRIIVSCGMLFFCQAVYAASTVQGIIYDKQRNTLPDISVELLNDYRQTINRARTDVSGRYQFNGLSDGRYTVKAFAFRYDLLDQEQPVEIITQNITGTEGVGFFPLDFYLLPKKGGLADAEIGVIFAQEIPSDAKKLYDQAVKDISDKKMDAGITKLNDSVKIFPSYYLALHRMGKELFIMQRYKESIPFLLRAVEVNPKSAISFYYLGNSLFHLGKDYNKAAITTLNQAFLLAPASPQVLFVLGKAERSTGNFSNAEKHLLEAKKLSKVSVPEIHKELAQLYSEDLKKYSEAADELELYIKSGNLDDAGVKQTRKVISNLRQKAQSQSSKN